MKKRDWTIRRHCVATTDAQRRWDQAYQLLVQWSTTGPEESSSAPAGASRQEEDYEDRFVCTGLNPTTSTNPNH